MEIVIHRLGGVLGDRLLKLLQRGGLDRLHRLEVLQQLLAALLPHAGYFVQNRGFYMSRLELPVVGRIAALGIAPFIMQSTESLVTVVLNSGLQFYGGDLYVATVTVMQSVMQMVVMPVQGITQGVQPIMSYNFGAKNYARVRETFRLLLRTTLTVTISAFLLVFLFPKPLALIFNGDLELVELTGQVMPIFFGGIWAFGAQMACQSAFMAMGQAKTSLFLALLRKVILLVPLAILLPWITGSVMGIYAAEPVADILASATTLTLFLHKRKTLLPAQNREK